MRRSLSAFCCSAPGAAGAANEDKRRAQTQAEHHTYADEECSGEKSRPGGRPVRKTERDTASELTTGKIQCTYCC